MRTFWSNCQKVIFCREAGSSKENMPWNLLDNNGILTALLVLPLTLFLVAGYINEDSVRITMPIFLYWYGLLFTLISIHSIKQGVFRFFDRGPVFAGSHPILFWTLITTEFFVAFLLFSAATIYLVDKI